MVTSREAFTLCDCFNVFHRALYLLIQPVPFRSHSINFLTIFSSTYLTFLFRFYILSLLLKVRTLIFIFTLWCIIRLEIVGGNCEKFTKIEKDLVEELSEADITILTIQITYLQFVPTMVAIHFFLSNAAIFCPSQFFSISNYVFLDF